MYRYHTPGVYFEWLDTPAVIGPRRTDIAGFVGVATRGTLFKPFKVESMTQFTSTFGGLIPQGYLAYAVRGFFANGGVTCYVVRVADPQKAKEASLTLLDNTGRPTLMLTARSPGLWGRQVRVELTNLGAERFSLTLGVPGQGQELWRDLSLDRRDPKYVITVLNGTITGSRLVEATDLRPIDQRIGQNSFQVGGQYSMQGGSDGLITMLHQHIRQGLDQLRIVDEVSMLAIPDLMFQKPSPSKFVDPIQRCDVLEADPDFALPDDEMEYPPDLSPTEISILQWAMIGQCEGLKDRIAILDMPPDVKDVRAAQAWRNNFDSKYAAIYFPWLRVPDVLRLGGELLRSVPPSGHIAGVYARGDLATGVHKPPANEALEGVEAVTVEVDDIAHGMLNEQGINAIRPYPGRGLRVAGARTLSSDALWRYVNVRRLLMMIEEAVEEQLQWVVFENNHPDLWRELSRLVRSFLDGLWRRGMLDGVTAEQAYTVTCDETTNPPAETDQGRLICQIGVRPPWPAEFVVVRIGKTEYGTLITETGENGNG